MFCKKNVKIHINWVQLAFSGVLHSEKEPQNVPSQRQRQHNRIHPNNVLGDPELCALRAAQFVGWCWHYLSSDSLKCKPWRINSSNMWNNCNQQHLNLHKSTGSASTPAATSVWHQGSLGLGSWNLLEFAHYPNARTPQQPCSKPWSKKIFTSQRS